MRRRRWIWIGTVAAIVATPVAVRTYHARREEGEFQEQLRLARSEGIPTSASEFASHVQAAKASENAAPFYRSLKGGFKMSREYAEVDASANFHPTSESLRRAEALLKAEGSPLALADKAAKLPRCWFNRVWEGEATLFPEYADMKNAAKLLGIRGTLEAQRGDVSAAIADVRSMFVIAKHAGEEPHPISHLVRESIYVLGLRELASWAFLHRDQRPYVAELNRAVNAFPKPDIEEEMLGTLYGVLSLIELCATEQGREKLGLKEDDMPKAAGIFSILLSQSKSRIEIVRAERALWAALDKSEPERAQEINQASSEINSNLLAFPVAAHVYEMLGGAPIEWASTRMEDFEARRIQYVALCRALSQSKIPASLNTSDLKSPYDGKPISYRFDGHQIIIEVPGAHDGSPKALKLPRDSELGK